MKVIIQAGGLGTRLPNSAKEMPKVLVEAGGKPVIQHIIDLLGKHHLTDLRFSLGFRADQIIKYLNGRYEYVVEPKPLGTGGAVKFASQDLTQPFMVIQGDLVANFNLTDFINFYQRVGLPNAMIVKFHQDLRDYGSVVLGGDRIVQFLEKSSKVKSGYGNVGCFIFLPETFSQIKENKFSLEYDLFPKLAAEGKLAGYVHQGYWIDTGTEERLKQAREDFRNRMNTNQ